MIPLKHYFRKKCKLIHNDKKNRLPRDRSGRGKRGVAIFISLIMEMVSQTCVCTHICIKFHTFKCVQFTVYQLYPNKAVLKI